MELALIIAALVAGAAVIVCAERGTRPEPRRDDDEDRLWGAPW